MVEALHVAVRDSLNADGRAVDFHRSQWVLGAFFCRPEFLFVYPCASTPSMSPTLLGRFHFQICPLSAPFLRVGTSLCSTRSSVAGRVLGRWLLALCTPSTTAVCSRCFSAAAQSRFRAAPGDAGPRVKQEKARQLQKWECFVQRLKLAGRYTGDLKQQAREQLLLGHREQHVRQARAFPLRRCSSTRQQQEAAGEAQEGSHRLQQRQSARLPTHQERQQRKQDDGTLAARAQGPQLNALEDSHAPKANGTSSSGDSMGTRGASGAAVQTPGVAAGNTVAKIARDASSEAVAGAPASGRSYRSYAPAASETNKADAIIYSAAARTTAGISMRSGSSDRSGGFSCHDKHADHHVSCTRRSSRDSDTTSVHKKWSEYLHTEKSADHVTVRRRARATPALAGIAEGFTSEGATGFLCNTEDFCRFAFRRRWPHITEGGEDPPLLLPPAKTLVSMLLQRQRIEQACGRCKKFLDVIFMPRALGCQAVPAACRPHSLHLPGPCGGAYPAQLPASSACHGRPTGHTSAEHSGIQLWQGEGHGLLHRRESMEQLHSRLLYAGGIPTVGLDRSDALVDAAFLEYMQALLPVTEQSERRLVAAPVEESFRKETGLLSTLSNSVSESETTTYSSVMDAPVAATARDTALPLYTSSNRRASTLIMDNCVKSVAQTEAVAVLKAGARTRESPCKGVNIHVEEVTGQLGAIGRQTTDIGYCTPTSAYASVGMGDQGAEKSAMSARTLSIPSRPLLAAHQKEPRVTSTHEFRQQEKRHVKQRRGEQQMWREEQEGSDLELVQRQTQGGSNNRQVNHWLCEVPRQDSKRIRALTFLLKAWLLKRRPGDRGIVFCDCQQEAALLACHPLLSVFAKPLHAGLSRDLRTATLRAFQAGTDSALREADLPSVDFVVHYVPPDTSEAYLRRARCAGRPFANESKRRIPDGLGKRRFDAKIWHGSNSREGASTNRNCHQPSGSDQVEDKDGSTSDGADESSTSNVDFGDRRNEAALKTDKLYALPAEDKKGERVSFQKMNMGRDGEDGNAASGHGLSVLLVDRGNLQHQAVARHLTRVLRVDFSVLALPSAEDMDKRRMDDIEEQLLSPAALRLGKPLQPAAELQLQLHGPRLLAAALALLLQKQHHVTWQSALCNQFSFMPLLFQDPYGQVLRSKQDLLQLLDAALQPTMHQTGASDSNRNEKARSHTSIVGNNGAKNGTTSSSREREVTTSRKTGSESSNNAAQGFSERLLAAGIGRIRLSSRGYVVDVSASAARRVLQSDALSNSGIKVSYVTGMQLLLGSHGRLRRKYVAPPTERELTWLQQQVIQASSKKARMRAAKHLADRRMQHQLHCMRMRQRHRSAVMSSQLAD